MIFCDHKDEERTGRACEHLLTKKEGSEYFTGGQKYHRFFTGKGAEYAFICPDCAADEVQRGASHWRIICSSCMLDICGSQKLSDLGSPEILIGDTGLVLKHESYDMPEGTREFRAIAPLGRMSDGAWVVITEQGVLMTAVPRTNRWEKIVELTALPINPAAQVSLVTSEDGRYVAIVNTYDSKGCVWDIEKRSVVLSFDRKNYHNKHCRYPVVFVQHENKVFVIYGTDWNRLDVTDLGMGKLVTARVQEPDADVNKRPAHYLDYFHCGLAVSPDGEWIADNGWVWHPVGILSIWNLKRWLSENVWESEDGPSKKSVCARDYYWDGPMCWVDKHVLAVWGLGDDDYTLVPGVMLFDVTTGQELKRLVGPLSGSTREIVQASEQESSLYNAAGSLLFDEHLFAWQPGKPFSVWDVNDGARLLEVSDFSPLAYHYGTKEFLSVRPDGKLWLSRVL